MGIIDWLLEKPRRDYYNDCSSSVISIKRREVNILNLRVGDYVTYKSIDYYVRQRYLYRAGAFEWIAYQFSDSDKQNHLWLDVENDDEISIEITSPITLPSEVDLTILRSKTNIVISGETFQQDEYGTAQVRIEKEDKRWDSSIVEYWDYYSNGNRFLSIEKWGNELEASIGVPIKDYELEIYPGS